MYITKTPLPGVNIRDSGDINLAKLICSGEKKIETRNTNSLNKYVGSRVRIIRTGLKKKKAQIVGECTIKSFKIYETKKDFEKDIPLHLINDNSEFKFNGYKVGYIITNPILYPFTYNAYGLGYVVRLNQPYPEIAKINQLRFKKNNDNFIDIEFL